MKKLINLNRFTNYLFKLCLICLGFGAMSFVSEPVKESNFRVLSSKISLMGSGEFKEWNSPVRDFNFDGNFVTKDETLEDISGFHFNFPITQFKNDTTRISTIMQEAFEKSNGTEITFNQKNIMILPIMRMVHVVGELKMMNKVHAVPMQMSYVVNDDESITLSGKQVVKLSEYGIDLPNVKPGTVDDEIYINIEFVLAKNELVLAKSF